MRKFHIIEVSGTAAEQEEQINTFAASVTGELHLLAAVEISMAPPSVMRLIFRDYDARPGAVGAPPRGRK